MIPMFFVCAFGWLENSIPSQTRTGIPLLQAHLEREFGGMWWWVGWFKVPWLLAFWTARSPNISPPPMAWPVPQHSQRSRRLPVGHFFFEKSWRGHVTTVQNPGITRHVSHQKAPHFHQNQQTSDLPLLTMRIKIISRVHIFKILQSLSNPPIKGQGWKPLKNFHEKCLDSARTSMQISLCNISRKAWSCPKRHNVGSVIKTLFACVLKPCWNCTYCESDVPSSTKHSDLS